MIPDLHEKGYTFLSWAAKLIPPIVTAEDIPHRVPIIIQYDQISSITINSMAVDQLESQMNLSKA